MAGTPKKHLRFHYYHFILPFSTKNVYEDRLQKAEAPNNPIFSAPFLITKCAFSQKMLTESKP